MTQLCNRVLALLLGAAAPSVAAAQPATQDPEIPVVRRVQDPSGEGRKPVVGVPDDEAAQRAKEEMMRGDSETGAPKRVGPPPIPSDLASHMTPTLGFVPRRIAPGASGVARLALAMQGNSVLAVGTHFEVVYPAEQVGVRFGQWVLAQPAIGVAPGAFRGRPVYENYASIEIPVEVPAGTPYGKFPIRVTVVADISDGRNGNTIRRSQAQAVGELIVGPPLPTPPPPSASASIRSGAATVRDPERGDDGSLAATAAGGSERVAAEVDRPDPERREPDSPAAVDPTLPVDADDRSLLWLGLGVGAIVVAAAALLVVRRR